MDEQNGPRDHSEGVSRRDFLHRGVAVGVGVLALSRSGPASSQTPEVTLRYATGFASKEPTARAMVVFKDSAESKSNGRIRVEVFDSGKLGGTGDLLDQARSGAISMMHATPSFFGRLVPSMVGLSLPYLFTSKEQIYEVVDGPVGSGIIVQLTDHGLQPLGAHDLGFRHVLNNVRPIQQLADFKGIKLRLQPNPSHIAAFERLGANPVALSFSELYSSLEQKVVDGYENALTTVLPGNFQEVIKFISLTSHAYEVVIKVMNKDQYDKLPADLKEVVREATDDEVRFQRKEQAQALIDARSQLEKAGVKVNDIAPAEIAKFAEIVRPIYSEFEAEVGADLLKQLRNVAG